MLESHEFRVVEEFAPRLFDDREGVKLGSGLIRLVRIASGDPKLPRVGALQRSLIMESGRAFFHGWDIKRLYARQELETAELLQLKLTSVFEPAGEHCGTKYDESTACPECASGAKQSSDFFLEWNRIPKSKDMSKTIAGEMVVSHRLVELFQRHKVIGAEFLPLRRTPASEAVSKEWFHLSVINHDVEVAPPTKTGVDPFDEDELGRFRCPRGDLIGLSLLSEVSVKRFSYSGVDVCASKQFVGLRSCLLRPERLLFISPKLWRLLERERLKGLEVEVAHLV